MASVDQFILLRHARAGSKLRDRARDFERRLDPKGREVALRLPETIAVYPRPELILSSPFRRCVQTVEPLARALGMHVVEDERFTPNRSAKAVREAFGDSPANSVVCTHGEVITMLFDGTVKCAKGAFWIVERRKGTFIPTLYVEAPAARQQSVPQPF
jgi:8-oxo-dGTP diphosphatase